MLIIIPQQMCAIIGGSVYERNMEKEKIFVITIALIVGIIGTAATFAIITATAGTVTNTFQAAKVATEIEEEFEGGIRAGSTVKKIRV